MPSAAVLGVGMERWLQEAVCIELMCTGHMALDLSIICRASVLMFLEQLSGETMKTLPPSSSVERRLHGTFSCIMWECAYLHFLSAILLSGGEAFFQVALSASLGLSFCTNATCLLE